MRRAANKDKKHAEIVGMLRAAGCSVKSWGIDGAPDLVVGVRGRTFLLEVKSPIGPRGGAGRDGQKLGELQERWHRDWRGQVAVVRTAVEALIACGIASVPR